MLYINNGLTISDQPKRDSSNDVETIITLPTDDANTKMAYASTRRAQLKLNVASPYTDSTHYSDISSWADTHHRVLTPQGLWSVGGNYAFPEHPGWAVAEYTVSMPSAEVTTNTSAFRLKFHDSNNKVWYSDWITGLGFGQASFTIRPVQ